jgi:hypothetical protein
MTGIDRWVIPAEVELSEDSEWLQWTYAAEPNPTDEHIAGGRRSMADVLPLFLRLERLARMGELQRLHLVRFASTWGVFHHEGNAGPGACGRDRVAVWARTAQFFASIDRIAGALDAGHAADGIDAWVVLRWLTPGDVGEGMFALPIPSVRGDRRPPSRELLCRALSRILAASGGDLVPGVRRDRGAPGGVRFQLEARSLWAGLAIALLRRVQGAGEADLRHCAGCGRLIVPERPHATRKAWCGRCRADSSLANRMRKRESRARLQR